jgi:hypothetical protein
MSMFRAKKLDLGCFTNIKIIRDHSKRKAYEAAEAERYGLPRLCPDTKLNGTDIPPTGKPSATSSATRPSRPGHAPSPSCS